jgi:arsenite methyltransferase
MKSISVYDPALCCSTGVCGTSVDPALAKFAADLDWLKKQGVTVSRYNLSQQAGAFVDNPTVRELLQKEGETVLPVVMIEGKVKSSKTYPDREELAEWLEVKAAEEATQKTPPGGCCGPKGCC